MNKVFLLNEDEYTTTTQKYENNLHCTINKKDSIEIDYISRLEFPSPNKFLITTNNSSTISGYYAIYGQEIYLSINGTSFTIKSFFTQNKSGDLKAQYKSPMPGKVIKVSVSKGDKVIQGQNLMVIEAMKIENLIQAKSDGTVEEINCKEGELVDPEKVLLKLI